MRVASRTRNENAAILALSGGGFASRGCFVAPFHFLESGDDSVLEYAHRDCRLIPGLTRPIVAFLTLCVGVMPPTGVLAR